MRRTMAGRILGIAAAVAGFAATEAKAADFVWPVSGTCTSSYWTWRGGYYHKAIDIAAPYWRAVGASRWGYVRYRGWNGGYGRLVIVGHASGYSTYYAHNIAYGRSGSVGRLTTISYVGSTGWSTGPHCHFEIRRWGGKIYVPARYGSWISKGGSIWYNYAGI